MRAPPGARPTRRPTSALRGPRGPSRRSARRSSSGPFATSAVPGPTTRIDLSARWCRSGTPPGPGAPPGAGARGFLRLTGALAVAAALLGVTAGCALFFEEPTVRIAGVRITGVDLTGARAEIGLEIENPNGFSLTSTGLSYRLAFEDRDATADREVEWRTIAEGESEEPVTVPAEETGQVTLSIPFRYEDVGRAVQSFLLRGELRYRLEGALRVDAPLGEVRVPFDRTGDVGP